MLDGQDLLTTSLNGLGWDAWIDKIDVLADDDCFVEPLGKRHVSILLEKKPTLLVTFETHSHICTTSDTAHPLGWQMVRALEWSHLCIVSNGDTWFRDPWVFRYFDRLIEDGFFDEFERIVFYGAGACGYAAAAYSVAAPGANVVLVQPQATLDPRVAEWDSRFTHMRRVSFTDRYGYAPDMIEAAKQTFVLYDPDIRCDAMHAALFIRENVTRFRMRYLGQDMENMLIHTGILWRILAQASSGKLSRLNLARIYRRRRTDLGYQLNLLRRVNNANRHLMTVWVCQTILAQRDLIPIRKVLARAQHKLK